MTATAGQAERADRITGALLGVHVGDALGASLEFSSWSEIRKLYPDGLRDIVGGGPFGWPPGHATDDTDLTRAVLLAYLQASGGDAGRDAGRSDDDRPDVARPDVVRAAAGYMLAWLDGDWPGREPGSRPRDIGAATQHGLERYRRSGDPRAAGAGEGQAGNGSLMRCIPTALAVTDRERRIRESVEISAITHDDTRAVIACAAYNEIAAALVSGAASAGAASAGLAAARELGSPLVAAAIADGQVIEPAVLASPAACSVLATAARPSRRGGPRYSSSPRSFRPRPASWPVARSERPDLAGQLIGSRRSQAAMRSSRKG